MMLVMKTRLHVTENGRLDGPAPAGLTPGEHEAVLVVEGEPAPKKRFRVENLPRHQLGWDAGDSLRREDMYGDDGR